MDKLTVLKRELTEELRGNILPFWIERMTDHGPRGGFYGRITGDGRLEPEAPRGAVMYARILWTFAAAYRMFGDKEYLATAQRAKEYLLKHFYDREYGGLFWSVDADGKPRDDRKQIYALGFAVYGLSELFRASGDREALEYAVRLFDDIENHSLDPVHNGYTEATRRDWSPADDMRLSEKDENQSKTMNTHLHILEPYTNLYRALKEAPAITDGFDTPAIAARVGERLVNLTGIFLEKIYRPSTGHLGLFFSDEWTETSTGAFSYGHDIEASWLLLEAAFETGDETLIERVRDHAARIAEASLEGYRPDGSMVYEKHADGTLDEDRHWWVQAEAVVGLFYQWKYYGRQEALDMALMTWDYIKTRLVDTGGGEWFWSIRASGEPDRADDKAGFWKCPYHSGRMCMELISLIDG